MHIIYLEKNISTVKTQQKQIRKQIKFKPILRQQLIDGSI